MKRKPGRPSGKNYPVTISTRVSQAVLDNLEAVATRYGVPVSTVARWALSGDVRVPK